MKKEDIFKNLFEELYFKINNLNKEIKSIKDTNIAASNGYKLALDDFKKIISELEERKDLYLKS